MLLLNNNFNSLIFTLATIHLVHSHVPVFIWSNNANLEAPPTQISDAKFESYLSEALESSHSKLLGFVLPSLSLEDLSVVGKGKLPNLDAFLENAAILPAVPSPGKTLDKLKTFHVSQPAKLLQGLGKNDMVLVDFKVDSTQQDRTSYMQHIDKLIGQYMKQLASYKETVITLLTGESPSWDITNDHHSMGRHLLDVNDEVINEYENVTSRASSSTPSTSTASTSFLNPIDTDNGTFYVFTSALVYISNISYHRNTSENIKLLDLQSVEAPGCNNDTCNIIIKAKGDIDVNFEFFFNSSATTYWLQKTTASVNDDAPINLTLACGYVEVPRNFSFSCYAFILRPTPGESQYTFLLHRFQVEPFVFPPPEEQKAKFHDSFDCEPFLTVPVFMGLFVVVFLTTILAVGIYALLSLKTPDRFDDPKSKLALIISPSD